MSTKEDKESPTNSDQEMPMDENKEASTERLTDQDRMASEGNKETPVESMLNEQVLADEEHSEDDQEFINAFLSKRAKLETPPEPKSKLKNAKPRGRRKECKCDICFQSFYDKDLKMYGGHPNNAVDEYMALISEELTLFDGCEDDVNQSDLRATNKITYFK